MPGTSSAQHEATDPDQGDTEAEACKDERWELAQAVAIGQGAERVRRPLGERAGHLL